MMMTASRGSPSHWISLVAVPTALPCVSVSSTVNRFPRSQRRRSALDERSARLPRGHRWGGSPWSRGSAPMQVPHSLGAWRQSGNFPATAATRVWCPISVSFSVVPTSSWLAIGGWVASVGPTHLLGRIDAAAFWAQRATWSAAGAMLHNRSPGIRSRTAQSTKPQGWLRAPGGLHSPFRTFPLQLWWARTGQGDELGWPGLRSGRSRQVVGWCRRSLMV